MTTLSERLVLTAAKALELPDGPAVYVLWKGIHPVYAGYVDPTTQPLGLRILGHVRADGQVSATGATHFSYEISRKPRIRLQVVVATLDSRRLVRPQLIEANLEPVDRRDPIFNEATLPPMVNQSQPSN